MEQRKKVIIDITKDGPSNIKEPNTKYQELFYQDLEEALLKFDELLDKAKQK